MNTLVINTDGGSRSNPGQAAVGVVLSMGDIRQTHGRCLGIATNNVAEYTAVLDAIGLVPAFTEANGLPDRIEFRLDSQLVERQLAGIYKIKEPALKELAARAKEALASLTVPYGFTYVPRAQNKLADSLVNEALDNRPA